MNSARKMVAWICIFSILLMGCYTSTMIAPTGDKKEEMHSGRIEAIVMSDETRCEFDSPPTIINNAIVGIARGDSVSIPLSNVLLVNVRTFDLFTTLVSSASIAVVALMAFAFIARGAQWR